MRHPPIAIVLLILGMAGCERRPEPPAAPHTEAPATDPAPGGPVDLAAPVSEPVAPEPDPLAEVRAVGDLVCPPIVASAEMTAQAAANENWLGAPASCTYGPIWSDAPEQAQVRFEIVATIGAVEAVKAAAAGQEAEDLGSGVRRLLSRQVVTVDVGGVSRAAERVVLEDVDAAPDWMPFARTRLGIWVVPVEDGRALAVTADYADAAEGPVEAAVAAFLAAQRG